MLTASSGRRWTPLQRLQLVPWVPYVFHAVTRLTAARPARSALRAMASVTRGHSSRGRSWPMPARSRSWRRDRAGGCATAGWRDGAVGQPVDDERRRGDLSQRSGAVAGREDRADLTAEGVGRHAAIEREAEHLAQRNFVGVVAGRAGEGVQVDAVLDVALAIGGRGRQEERQHLPAGLAVEAATGVGHDRDERVDALGRLRGQGLGDHAAHRSADDVGAVDLEVVEQPDCVACHVLERVGGTTDAPGDELGSSRRRRADVVCRSPAVAVVEPDHVEAAARRAARRTPWTSRRAGSPTR